MTASILMLSLERAETDDGLFLHGLREAPARSDANRAGGALLLVHGTGANFYHPGVLATFAAQGVEAGFDVWRVNTRGHDGIAAIPGRRGAVAGGATHESIADCRRDLAAWMGRIAEGGSRRVILVGHSMGAVKSIYFAAKDAPRIAAVVAISPPRFCHAVWMSHPKAGPFRDAWAKAARRVAEGRGDELMPVAQPVPFVATAAGFLAKYGPGDEYDVVRLLTDVSCPALVLIGTGSAATSPAFDGLFESLRPLAERRPSLSIDTVEGANTGYSGCEHVPFERAAAWFGALDAGRANGGDSS